MGTWTVCRFQGGGLGKKEGVVFLRGAWYPNAHYVETWHHMSSYKRQLMQVSTQQSINNMNTYKEKPGMPVVTDEIKPVSFPRFEWDRLLSKCLHMSIGFFRAFFAL